MPLVNVERHDLFEELIECSVAVGDDECALFGMVVVDVRDDLHRNVRLASACAG